ncbi:MAG: hypothetical protein PQ965_07405, partial [Methanobacteriaceae archaeon]
ATNLLIQLFNRQMPLNINLFPSHKLNYNDHSIKTFAQHYKLMICLFAISYSFEDTSSLS